METPDPLQSILGQTSAELQHIAALLSATEEALLDFVATRVEVEGKPPPGELQNLDRAVQFTIALSSFFEKISLYSTDGGPDILEDAIQQIGLVELKDRFSKKPGAERDTHSLELF